MSDNDNEIVVENKPLGLGVEDKESRYCISIGANACATGLEAIAIGKEAIARGPNSIAIGNGVEAGPNEVVIGGVKASVDNFDLVRALRKALINLFHEEGVKL